MLVHGDYRTGNYLVDETGVTTILDWELAHLGDPVKRSGLSVYVKSWRFGAVDKPAGGFGSREELWAAYERAGGGGVDPARAHWWEVFGTVHWGVICLNQAWKHLSGSIKSMEHASIGRRAVETRDRPVATAEAGSLIVAQDRPTAAELLAAIADFLREEATPALDRTEPRLGFQIRVAVNSLAILEREVRLRTGRRREKA